MEIDFNSEVLKQTEAELQAITAFVDGVTAAAVGAITGSVVVIAKRSIVNWRRARHHDVPGHSPGESLDVSIICNSTTDCDVIHGPVVQNRKNATPADHSVDCFACFLTGVLAESDDFPADRQHGWISCCHSRQPGYVRSSAQSVQKKVSFAGSTRKFSHARKGKPLVVTRIGAPEKFRDLDYCLFPTPKGNPMDNATVPPFVLQREFRAARTLLWQVQTQARHVQHWLSPEGFHTIYAEKDFRLGGR